MLDAVREVLESIVFGNGYLVLGGVLAIVGLTVWVRLSKGLDI